MNHSTSVTSESERGIRNLGDHDFALLKPAHVAQVYVLRVGQPVSV